jgi:hypothetical protein
MNRFENNLDISVVAPVENCRQDGDDNLDISYNDEVRRHRNRVSRLDHKFESITHPYYLAVSAICIIALYILAQFFGTCCECVAAKEAASTIWTVASYLLCIVVSYLLTLRIKR